MEDHLFGNLLTIKVFIAGLLSGIMRLNCVNPEELNGKTCIESKKEKEEKDKFISTRFLLTFFFFSKFFVEIPFFTLASDNHR